MTFVSSHSFKYFHHKAKEIITTTNLQDDEIRTSRRLLLDKAKETQDLCCLSMLRSGYFLHLSKDNVIPISNIPFLQPGGFKVSDRLVEILEISSMRSDLSRFITAIFKNFNILPSVLAELPSQSLKGKFDFLPQSTEANHFLAFSTLPSLFGFCWTDDFKYSYIDFLTQITEKLPSSAFTNLHDHWLLDCFKHYIHSSNIQQFLKASLCDPLLEIIRDKTLEKLPYTAKEEFFRRMIPYIEEIFERMSTNFNLIPHDVRVLIKKFADLAPDEAQRQQRVEFLFCNAILAPAISLPKVYSVLPQSISFKVNNIGTARALQVLASLFLFILHPTQAELRYPELDHKKLSSIPFGEFLDRLADVSIDTKGSTVTSLMPLLGMHCVLLVSSVPDILLLAHIIKKVSETNPELVKILLPLSKKLPLDQCKPYFFRFEVWEVSSFGLSKPDIVDNELEVPKQTPANGAAGAVMKFLSVVPEIATEPESLTDFLNFIEERSRLSGDRKAHTHANHALYKIALVSNKKDIVPALEDEIRRRVAFCSRNSSLLTQIALKVSDLTRIADELRQKAAESLPVFYEKMFELFKDSDKEFNQFESELETYATFSLSFSQMFESATERLSAKLSALPGFQLAGVLPVMHTYLLQQIPLLTYKTKHKSFAQRDAELTHPTQKTIQRLVLERSPQHIIKMFSQQNLFRFAKESVIYARYLEIPLETLKEFDVAFGLLRQTFLATFGRQPDSTEIEPMTDYLILTSGIADMLSFAKYLDHFLGDQKWVPKQLQDTLKLLLQRVSFLDHSV